MIRFVLLLLVASGTFISAQPSWLHSCASGSVKYGSNPAAGRTFTHDDVKLYYEVYGHGDSLLIVHGNGGSIADVAAQIDHFRKTYQVIAMDSRDQGRSGNSSGKLTYEMMSDDLAALLDYLKIGEVNVLGWSDGGIEALLLAIRRPEKVKKIAVMGAALNPSDQAVYPEVIAMGKSTLAAMSGARKATPEGNREIKLTQLLLSEPHIDPKILETISAPTLVTAGDHDLVRDEHTLEIYHHLSKAALAIFPNATHMLPFDDPALFNATVERFFRTPFVKKDRIEDLLKSVKRMRATDAPHESSRAQLSRYHCTRSGANRELMQPQTNSRARRTSKSAFVFSRKLAICVVPAMVRQRPRE